MPLRYPLRSERSSSIDRESAIDRTVRPYRDALREIRGLAAKGTLDHVDPREVLTEIDAAASRALGAPAPRPGCIRRLFGGRP